MKRINPDRPMTSAERALRWRRKNVEKARAAFKRWYYERDGALKTKLKRAGVVEQTQ